MEYQPIPCLHSTLSPGVKVRVTYSRAWSTSQYLVYTLLSVQVLRWVTLYSRSLTAWSTSQYLVYTLLSVQVLRWESRTGAWSTSQYLVYTLQPTAGHGVLSPLSPGVKVRVTYSRAWSTSQYLVYTLVLRWESLTAGHGVPANTLSTLYSQSRC